MMPLFRRKTGKEEPAVPTPEQKELRMRQREANRELQVLKVRVRAIRDLK
jgi:hypothetical protein